MNEQFYFWRVEPFSTIALPLVIAATRVVSPQRVEGELNLIVRRPPWLETRYEVEIVSAPPDENGLPLSEQQMLEELQQRVKQIIESQVSGEELTAFNKSGRPLRLEIPASHPLVAQLMGQYRSSFEQVEATTRWPSLKSDLQARLAALANQPSPTSLFE